MPAKCPTRLSLLQALSRAFGDAYLKGNDQFEGVSYYASDTYASGFGALGGGVPGATWATAAVPTATWAAAAVPAAMWGAAAAHPAATRSPVAFPAAATAAEEQP